MVIGPANAGENEQWIAPSRVEPGFQGILISDLVNSFQLFSLLQAYSDKPVSGSTYNCITTSDPNCKESNRFGYTALLPVCENDRDLDCIVEIRGSKGSTKNVKAKFEEYVYPNHLNRFKGDPALLIPDPAEPSIWDLSAIRHSGGGKYAAIVGVSGGTSRENPKTPENFYAYLVPVEKVSTGVPATTEKTSDGFIYNYPQCQVKTPGERGEARVGCMGMPSQGLGENKINCALLADEGTDCFAHRAFPKEAQFSLKVRLSSPVSGWLHGRMQDPRIVVKEGANSSTELEITAGSVTSPIFYSGDVYSNLPAKLQDAYKDKGSLSKGGFFGRLCCEIQVDPNKRNSTSTPWSYGEDSIKEMQLWLDHAGDRAAALPSLWSVRTLPAAELEGASKCFTRGKELKGIVTTNSTTYSEGPPKFENDSLVYRVASPHLTPTGETYKGIYNLVMRSDTARCLYGFSNAPISATIEVVTDQGVSDVATTLFGESNGWVHLSAANFTFSAPEIRATLNQTTSAKKVEQVTCIKGKKAKKLAVGKSKCPKGYKKA